jgi:4-amino-4-deoxy-L-arabinose transferase-like glycosyltransferase
MFESYEEAEKNRGLKGFLSRHFGPVVHLDLAEEGIRQIGIVFMVLSILVGIVGMARTGSALALVDAFILAFLGFMLYLTKSRTSAVFLMAYSVLGALLAFPAVAPWIWVLFSARAIQLTFGYRRLLKLRSAALTAME